MAAVVRLLKDRDTGDKIYPVTNVNAVFNNNGDTIQDVVDEINDNISAILDETKPNDFIVTLTRSNSTWVADKTYAQIVNAYNAGALVIVKIDEHLHYLVAQGTGIFQFLNIPYDEKNCQTWVYLASNGTWAVSSYYVQHELTFDNTPTANSDNPVKSSGIKTALDGKQDDILVVTLTKSMGNITGNKTISQINTALSNGTEVIVKYQGRIYHHTKSDTGTSPATPEFSCLDAFTNKIYGVYATSLGWFENTVEEQSKLVSGTSIKTVNNTSLLGSGNVDVTEFTELTAEEGLMLWTKMMRGTISDQTAFNAMCEKINAGLSAGKQIRGTITTNDNVTFAIISVNGIRNSATNFMLMIYSILWEYTRYFAHFSIDNGNWGVTGTQYISLDNHNIGANIRYEYDATTDYHIFSAVDEKVAQTASSANADIPLLLASGATPETAGAKYDADFKFNPSSNTLKLGTGTLTATNYSGNAATATSDDIGNNISLTYATKSEVEDNELVTAAALSDLYNTKLNTSDFQDYIVPALDNKLNKPIDLTGFIYTDNLQLRLPLTELEARVLTAEEQEMWDTILAGVTNKSEFTLFGRLVVFTDYLGWDTSHIHTWEYSTKEAVLEISINHFMDGDDEKFYLSMPNEPNFYVFSDGLKTINSNSLIGSGDITVNEIASISTVESSVSGGNNVVTITDTNGNETSFSVKNGADGGQIGDVAIVQDTGERTDAVMSQRATTVVTERLTEDDLSSVDNMAFSLPDGYLPCDYITNGVDVDHKGSIMTGIVPTGTTWRFVIKMKLEATPANLQYLWFGRYNDAANKSYMIQFNKSTAAVNFTYYTKASRAFGVNTTQWHVYDWNVSRCMVDDTALTYTNSSATFTNEGDMYLSGNVWTSVAYIKMYNGSELVADMRPCVQGGSTAGFYDVVREQFITTSTEGAQLVAVGIHSNSNNRLLNGEGLASLITQETGDSEVKMMSQKTVTEYGRKVTAEDLAGTSDWIKAKLTEEGWELGKYIKTNGALANNANCCVSPFLPVSMSEHQGHKLVLQYMYYIYASWCACYYDSNKTYISGAHYQGIDTNTRTVTVGISDSWDNVAYVRYTFGSSKLSECFIYDDNIGEYLFKGDEYISEICNSLNLTVGSLEQTKGESVSTTMSQKSISDAVNYNLSIQNCQCINFKTDQNLILDLNDLQYETLNNTDIISIRIVSKTGSNGSYYPYRYVKIGGHTADSSTLGFYLSFDYSRRMFAAGANYNTATCINKTSGGTIINPAVMTIVWNKIEGTVKFYERNNLISTQTYDAYKITNFISSAKSIRINSGVVDIYLYDFQVFDYDIFKKPRGAYETSIFGASYVDPWYDGNLSILRGQWQTVGTGDYGATAALTYTKADGVVTITSTSSAVAGSSKSSRGYYVGTDKRARRWESDIEVVSGTCKITQGGNGYISGIVDNNTGDVYPTGSTLGVGSYTIQGVAIDVNNWDITYMSGDPMVVRHTANRQKYISCVVHLKCDTLYNGQLYDDQADKFYASKKAFANSTPFTSPLYSTSYPPNYAGQMAIGSSLYVGNNAYTWKQINNS